MPKLIVVRALDTAGGFSRRAFRADEFADISERVGQGGGCEIRITWLEDSITVSDEFDQLLAQVNAALSSDG